MPRHGRDWTEEEKAEGLRYLIAGGSTLGLAVAAYFSLYFLGWGDRKAEAARRARLRRLGDATS